MAGALHGDVASAIGQQVEQMILQAKKDSEARVRHDLSVAKGQLAHMETIIGELTERVARCALANRTGTSEASETVDRTLLSTKIAKLEQKWGSEVKALKQDLHRTILAHNHNSDLMRHHRDALDEAKRKVDAVTQPISEQVDMQIEKVERILRAGATKQRALDALTERLTQLEAQVAEMLPSAAMPPGFPGMLPGMAGLGKHAVAEDMHSQLLQAAARSTAGADSGFNAEAPVFVPRAVAASPPAEAASGGGEAAATKAAAAAALPPGLEVDATAPEAAEGATGAAAAKAAEAKDAAEEKAEGAAAPAAAEAKEAPEEAQTFESDPDEDEEEEEGQEAGEEDGKES